MNSKNFAEPVLKNYIEKGYFIATVGSQFTVDIRHKIASLTTDTGVIFEDENTINFFEHEETEFLTVATIEQGKGNLDEFQAMFQIRFYISRNKINYKRDYIKIQDALANVGGFMGLVIEVIKTLISFYLDNEYGIFLYQNLFKLEIEKEDESKEKDIPEQEISIELKPHSIKLEVKASNDLSYDKSEDKKDSSKREILGVVHDQDQISFNKPRKSNLNFKLKPVIINKEVKNLINYKDKKRETISIGRCERFCYLCFSSFKSQRKNFNLRLELINNAEAEISKKFDIIEHLKVQNQIRLLKKLLLNENQCYLLENRELHLLNNNKSIKMPLTTVEIEDLDLITEKQKSAKLIEYLKNKKQDNSFSVVDTLLLKYSNQEMKAKIKTEVDLDQI